MFHCLPAVFASCVASVLGQAAAQDCAAELAYANVSIAYARLNARDFAGVHEALQRVPNAYRGWEWRYLDRARDRSGDAYSSQGSFFDQPVITPDAKFGAEVRTVRGDYEVAVFDLATAKESYLLRGFSTFLENQPCLSADGSMVAGVDASGLALIGHRDGPPVTVPSPQGESRLYDIDLAPAGDRFLALGRKSVAVWTVNPLKEQFIVHGADRVRFSPDGTLIYGRDSTHGVAAWNAETGEKTTTFASKDTSRTWPLMSPDSAYLAAGGQDPASVRLWSASDGKLLATLGGFAEPVYNFSFSSDSKWLLVAARDGYVKVWPVPAANYFTAYKVGDAGAMCAAMSPDGSRVAAGASDGTIRMWDRGRPYPPQSSLIGHGDSVRGIRFSPDNKRLFTTSNDRTMRVWDVTYRSIVKFKQPMDEGDFYLADLSADARRAVVVRHLQAPNVPLLLDASGLGEALPLADHKRGVSLATFSPDGSLLVTSDDSGTVLLRNGSDGAIRAKLEGHTHGATAAAFDPDGKHLYTADRVSLRKWDIEAGQLLETVDGLPGEHVVAVSRDGVYLAIDGPGGQDLGLVLWNRNDRGAGRPLADLQTKLTDAAWSVRSGVAAFSPDSGLVAAQLDTGELMLWDTKTGSSKVRTAPSDVRQYQYVFSPDGSRVAGAAEDGIHLWDTATGLETVKFPEGGWAIGFSKDGEVFANLWSEAMRFRDARPIARRTPSRQP
jgi:WD40 repeat protein